MASVIAPGRLATGVTEEVSTSAVAWPAIFGGALVAAASTIILLALGSGLGFASVSPWPGSGASVGTFTALTAISLIVVQWVSSGLGGYVTGRLRTRFVNTHSHEVFFRDTAHGLLAWALATVLGALLLASAASSIIGGTTRAVGSAASGVGQAAVTAATSNAYDVDTLFRSEKTDTGNTADLRAEAGRILTSALRSGEMPAADKTYLAQQIAARTGISQADAQKRVDDVIAQEKAAEVKVRQAADAARKTASMVAIFTALSMLIGAFIAAAAAAFGGSQRDEY